MFRDNKSESLNKYDSSESMMERRIINPWSWQDKYGFVQANEITGPARTLVCSGQTAIDPDGNAVHSGDIAAQLKITLDNLEEVLHKADFSLSDVVRMTIYTTDVDKLIAVYESMAARLAQAKCRTAQTLIGVTRLAFPDLMLEIEATAVK
jgi:enamine deaminase RidA (YjgF/YER057c/UK114 family)